MVRCSKASVSFYHRTVTYIFIVCSPLLRTKLARPRVRASRSALDSYGVDVVLISPVAAHHLLGGGKAAQARQK